MRLLIVDDERPIANYLASMIGEHTDEQELDIMKTYSGKDALDILSTMKVDLMLLDIHMPGMSGLDVAQKTAESWPKCHIIFLTAYSNFEHIYQSTKYENTSYLLKTETDEVIKNAVFSTLDKIRKDREGLHLLKEAKQKAILLKHLLQQNFLRELLVGYSMEELNREFLLSESDFTLDFQAPVYLLYIQVNYKTIDEYQSNLSTYCLEYLLLMEQLLMGKFDFAMLELDRGAMLWFFQPSSLPCAALSSDITFLKAAADDFNSYCSSTFHRRTAILLYDQKISWKQVCSIYHLIQQYTAASFDKFSRSFVITLDFQSLKSSVPTDPKLCDSSSLARQLQELSFYLYQHSPEQYLEILDAFCSDCVLLRSMHNIKAIKIYNKIAMLLLEYIDQYQLQEKLASRIAVYPLYYILDFPNWNRAFSYLKNLSLCIFDLISNEEEDKNRQLVAKLKNYIDEHLAQSLSLNTLSGRFNYNESYLSRLFRQTTGTTLSEYICQARIARAKELLVSTDTAIQEISSLSGFDTSQYFSLVFKKNTGMSPSEFRRSLKAES